jgi:2-polyprenyl-6-methoxyphenol hydroxylase-like FAD-dependent oxidoreductase
VGAGIGGLAAAVSVRAAGWDVQVLERASHPRELGFALLLAPNAIAALRTLGVADRVIAAGHVVRRAEMRRPDGRVLRRMDSARLDAIMGEPAVVALRPALHGALLDVVGVDALRLGSPVTGFSFGGEGVHVRLEDGDSRGGRVLIGADGVASVIRRQLRSGEPAARESGLFALRGVAYGVVPHLQGVSGAQYFGRGIEAGLAQASDDAVYWYMSLPAERVRYGAMTAREVLERTAAGFHEPFKAIVLATTDYDMRLDELLDREPLDRWGEGAVTLLGDAAHPMLPHAGQGAAQALEDAVALGRAFRRGGLPEQMLREYERVRAPRTAAVVRQSRRNASIGSLNGAAAVWLRDLAMKYVPDSVIVKSHVAIGKPVEEP